MTRYHKKNPFNNKVLVDYEKRTVRFEPVGAGTLYYYWFIWWNQLTTPVMLLLVATSWLVYPTAAFKLEPHSFALIVQLTSMVYLGLFASLSVVSLIYFIPSWRHRYFPSTNARLQRYLKLLLSFKRTTPKKILPSSVVNNKVFVPNFSNVELQYTAIGDMKTQLKRIRIDTIFDQDPWEWYFVFEFKKQPKDGHLMVMYQ